MAETKKGIREREGRPASVEATGDAFVRAYPLELNRIGYDGLKKDTMTNLVDDMLQPSAIPAVSVTETAGMPAARAPEGLKRLVRRTPLARLARARMRRDALRAELTDSAKVSLDLTPIFALGDAGFLREAVRMLFYRNIGSGEYYLLQMLKEGAPRGAVLYILFCSDEMDKTCAIKRFAAYEKAYFRYRAGNKIANIPVINYIVALAVMPIRVKNLQKLAGRNEADRIDDEARMEELLIHRVNVLREKIEESRDNVKSGFTAEMDGWGSRLAEMQKQLDELGEMLDRGNEGR